MKFKVPKGWQIQAVHIKNHVVGVFRYTPGKAIKEGHLTPINVSTGLYEIKDPSGTTLILTYKGE